jgi:hypothetical protein
VDPSLLQYVPDAGDDVRVRSGRHAGKVGRVLEGAGHAAGATVRVQLERGGGTLEEVPETDLEQVLRNGRGVVAISPVTRGFTMRIRGARTKKGQKFARTQLPLVPVAVRTCQSSQGRTFTDGGIMDTRKLEQMSADDYWLHIYTMLSRCTRLRDVLLTAPIPRDLLLRGPPTSVRTVVRELAEKRARTATRAADAIANLPAFTGIEVDEGAVEDVAPHHDAEDSELSDEEAAAEQRPATPPRARPARGRVAPSPGDAKPKKKRKSRRTRDRSP